MLHEQNLFTSGVGIRYRSQLMVEANNREVSLSDTFSLEIGTRLPPMNIVRFADWHPMDIQDLAASDGLFKIIIFSGDLQGDIESKGLREFAEHLQLLADKKQGSILFKQFTMFTVVTEYKESDIWSFIPPFLRNWRRIFTDRDSNINTEGNQNGVAKQRGTVVVRPDGYISAILEVSGRSAAFLCEYLKHL
ncbi:hypothetical protein D9757_015117 [Collybiopsis confluens]|uniref:Phenol hydroxylase-like C-terminal dimerisation domain-containing protein n=1 Tax=Collybiopsis confluens TaxID=2823264 RepID=A0A8H5C6A4_9AGAR|nr:hypothetical protein D9757_015117 [Collybiopsis confluens]